MSVAERAEVSCRRGLGVVVTVAAVASTFRDHVLWPTVNIGDRPRYEVGGPGNATKSHPMDTTTDDHAAQAPRVKLIMEKCGFRVAGNLRFAVINFAGLCSLGEPASSARSGRRHTPPVPIRRHPSDAPSSSQVAGNSPAS